MNDSWVINPTCEEIIKPHQFVAGNDAIGMVEAGCEEVDEADLVAVGGPRCDQKQVEVIKRGLRSGVSKMEFVNLPDQVVAKIKARFADDIASASAVQDKTTLRRYCVGYRKSPAFARLRFSRPRRSDGGFGQGL
jgi:polyribonucleotide nucleotidyltransferase